MTYKKISNCDLFIFKKYIIILILYNYMIEVAIVGCTVLLGTFLYIQTRFISAEETTRNEPSINSMFFIQR